MGLDLWIRAYGPPGQPTPRVFAPVLIGGQRSGEPFVALTGARDRLRMPVLQTSSLRVPDEPIGPSGPEFREDLYRRLTFASLDMAPLDFWVEEGLSDDDARALIFEHYFVGQAI